MEGAFHLIDAIILIGICQGIFLSFAIQRIPDNNKNANFILSILIGISTLILVGRFVFFRYLTLFIFQTSLIFDSFIYLFGPLLYMYTTRLLFRGKGSYILPIYHFLPFLLLFLSAFVNLFIWTKEEYYNYYLAGHLSLLFALITLSMILLNAYYLVRSYGLIIAYKKAKEENYSFKQSPLQYLYVFHFVVAACFITWLVVFISWTFFKQFFPFVNYDTLWMIIPLFLYTIGYFSLKQPELFRVPLRQKGAKRIRLNPPEAAALKEKLEILMEEEKLYINGDLSLPDIADRLGTSRNNLSWLINHEYDLPFNDFVNKYRIKAFLEKVEEGAHLKHTILAISMEVGFNSKSTFNKAFKREKGCTPSNYIRQMESVIH